MGTLGELSRKVARPAGFEPATPGFRRPEVLLTEYNRIYPDNIHESGLICQPFAGRSYQNFWCAGSAGQGGFRGQAVVARGLERRSR